MFGWCHQRLEILGICSHQNHIIDEKAISMAFKIFFVSVCIVAEILIDILCRFQVDFGQ